MYADMPSGIRCLLLRQLALQFATRRHGDPAVFGEEAARISVQLHQGNAEGAKLEREGHLDGAIQVYEAIVSEMYGGAHPYDHLRSIYARRGQCDEALRMYRGYVETIDALTKLGSPHCNLPIEPGRFTEWYTTLEAQLAKQEHA